MARFGPSEYTDYDKALIHTKQTGSLHDYQKEFERISSRVKDWPESALMGAFMGGLKPELSLEVRVHRPKNYVEAIELARLHDDYLSSKRAMKPEFRRLGASPSDSKENMANSRGESTGNSARILPQGVKRLAWDELQKRCEKGLCFNCNERFTLGHMCRVRQAFLIETTDSNEEDKTDEEFETDTAEVSVHAMTGINGPRTMRIGSWIRDRRVIILIDNGSSHNFINQDTARN